MYRIVLFLLFLGFQPTNGTLRPMYLVFTSSRGCKRDVSWRKVFQRISTNLHLQHPNLLKIPKLLFSQKAQQKSFQTNPPPLEAQQRLRQPSASGARPPVYLSQQRVSAAGPYGSSERYQTLAPVVVSAFLEADEFGERTNCRFGLALV